LDGNYVNASPASRHGISPDSLIIRKLRGCGNGQQTNGKDDQDFHKSFSPDFAPAENFAKKNVPVESLWQ
jgi:hypothetical protein